MNISKHKAAILSVMGIVCAAAIAFVLTRNPLTTNDVFKVEYGVTENQVVAILGPPQKKEPFPNGGTMDTWLVSDGIIKVKYNSDGVVEFRHHFEVGSLRLLTWRLFGSP